VEIFPRATDANGRWRSAADKSSAQNTDDLASRAIDHTRKMEIERRQLTGKSMGSRPEPKPMPFIIIKTQPWIGVTVPRYLSHVGSRVLVILAGRLKDFFLISNSILVAWMRTDDFQRASLYRRTLRIFGDLRRRRHR
jgi:hypothetical protein